MGADLIANTILIPDKKFAGIIKHGLLKLEAGLKTATTVKDIAELGVSIGDYENNTGDSYEGEADGFDRLIALVRGDMAEIKNVKTLEDIQGRDTSWHSFTVNGVAVTCFFAGEMSWGDSPEGYGYKMLGVLNNLGFSSAFYDAIPWDVRGKKK